jgi:hypothetical protein
MAKQRTGRCACGGTVAVTNRHGAPDGGGTVFDAEAACTRCGRRARFVAATPVEAERRARAALAGR